MVFELPLVRTNSVTGISDRALYFIYTFFIFGSTFSIAAGQVAAGLSLALFLLLAVLLKYHPFHVELKWFYILCGLYVCWMALAGQLARPGMGSLGNMREEWLFCIVPMGVYLFQKESRARFMITAFAVGVAFVSLYAIGQYFTGWHFLKPSFPPEAHEYGYRIIGNFTHPLTFANYYATAGLFLYGYTLLNGDGLSVRTRRLLLMVAILAMGVAVLSYSRGPTIAIAVTLIISSLLLRTRHVIGWVVVILAVMVAFGLKSGVFERAQTMMQSELSKQYDQGRMFIWTHSYRIAHDNPIFGVGPGYFHDAYAATLDLSILGQSIHGHAHDDLLNVAAQSGFPGALFFLAMWVSVWVYSWRAYKSSVLSPFERRVALAGLLGAICFFLTSITEATFADEEVRQMLMFVWAAGLAMYLKSKSGLPLIHPSNR
jgi:O-antigen ligase